MHNLVQNVNNSCGWQFCPSLLSTSDRIGLRAEKEMIPAFLSLRRNGKRLPGQHDLAQEAERLLFAAVAQHGQHIEKLAARVRVHHRAIADLLGVDEIVEGIGVRVGAAVVNFTGGDAVHDHLHKEFARHRHGAVDLRLRVDVRPVFVVVAVAALVVHPCGGVAVELALIGVRAARALIVFCAGPELCGGVFGQVVRQAAPIQPDAEAVTAHLPAVARDGTEMFPWMHL